MDPSERLSDQNASPAFRKRRSGPGTVGAALLTMALAGLAGGTYAWATTSPGPNSDTPDSAVAPQPIDIESVLKQAYAPTHSELTPWGLFVINPVIGGKSLLNPQGLPYPQFTETESRTLRASTPEELASAANSGARLIDVPEPARDGMHLQGMVLHEGRGQFAFDIAYYSGKGTTSLRSLRVTAFTPTQPVPFEEFPDNAIWDFAATNEVNGHPTLTVVPDAKTADPADERIVAWSQGSAVYYIRTTGVFGTDELLVLARQISSEEAAR